MCVYVCRSDNGECVRDGACVCRSNRQWRPRPLVYSFTHPSVRPLASSSTLARMRSRTMGAALLRSNTLTAAGALVAFGLFGKVGICVGVFFWGGTHTDTETHRRRHTQKQTQPPPSPPDTPTQTQTPTQTHRHPHRHPRTDLLDALVHRGKRPVAQFGPHLPQRLKGLRAQQRVALHHLSPHPPAAPPRAHPGWHRPLVLCVCRRCDGNDGGGWV